MSKPNIVPIRDDIAPVDPEPFIELGRQAAAKGAKCAVLILQRADGYTEVLASPDWLAIKENLTEAGHALMCGGEEE